MGGSSIAAIVLILIAILISLASIFWLKRNERLCFKPYQEVTVQLNIEDNTNGRLFRACTDGWGTQPLALLPLCQNSKGTNVPQMFHKRSNI
jgi:hypothetical protein